MHPNSAKQDWFDHESDFLIFILHIFSFFGDDIFCILFC
jgi:hypothetical protein